MLDLSTVRNKVFELRHLAKHRRPIGKSSVRIVRVRLVSGLEIFHVEGD